MKFEINIDYPAEKMELSRKRLEARSSFRYVDRVPVNYCIVPRYFAPLFNLRYIDFFKDAETQYYYLLQFAKYHIENIPSDSCTRPVIYIHPYFDNAVPPSGQGAEIGWTEDGPPRAMPVIHTVEQMDRFEIAKPDAGLRGRTIEWWQQMREFAKETKVIFNKEEGHIEIGILGLVGLSPHMIAVDLVGTDFYWWVLEYPENCHRFLKKIALGEIEAENLARKIDSRPRGDSYGLAEDSGQCMSAELFREFCVPYSKMIFENFGCNKRGIHICGKSAHLHKVLKDDLKMTSFDLFGYEVPPAIAASNLGGNTLMWGNINPMLMKDGTQEEIKNTTLECLKALAPCGGFMLGDGANVCPGTPLESFRTIMETAEEYGLGV